MDYADIILKIISQSGINPDQLETKEHNFYTLCMRKYNVDLKIIERKKNYNQKKYGKNDSKRAKTHPDSSLVSIFETLQFAYHAYDKSLNYNNSKKLVAHIHSLIYDNENEWPSSKMKKYKTTLKKAIKLKKIIDSSIYVMKINDSELSVESLANHLVSKLPDYVFNTTELTLFCELYKFSLLLKTFTLTYKYDRHLTPQTKTFNYVNLYNFLKRHKHLTTNERSFLRVFVDSVKHLNLRYMKIYELLTYDYNQNFFSDHDKTFIMRQLGINNFSKFNRVINTMISLKQKK